MRIDTAEDLVKYQAMLGKRVTKFRGRREPKPFKSGLKVNTVKGTTTHPTLGIMCFLFDEDDSYVECWRCKEIEEETKCVN